MILRQQDSKIWSFNKLNSGILKLEEKDYIKLNSVRPLEGGVKAVMGPGTGLG